MRMYNKLLAHYKDIKILSMTSAILSWDRDVYMPSLGVGQRTDSLVLLNSIIQSNEKSL